MESSTKQPLEGNGSVCLGTERCHESQGVNPVDDLPDLSFSRRISEGSAGKKKKEGGGWIPRVKNRLYIFERGRTRSYPFIRGGATKRERGQALERKEKLWARGRRAPSCDRDVESSEGPCSHWCALSYQRTCCELTGGREEEK